MTSSTSGIRLNKGKVLSGAVTMIRHWGRVCFNLMKRLCAMIMSPTQAGPTTRILGAIVVMVVPDQVDPPPGVGLSGAVFKYESRTAIRTQGIASLLDRQINTRVLAP